MNKSFYTLFFLAALAFSTIGGCHFRKEVSREKIGQTTVSKGVVGCRHYDYCYTCMPGPGPGCGFKFSAFCPGHRTATINSTVYLSRYDDGTSERFTYTTYTDVGECR